MIAYHTDEVLLRRMRELLSKAKRNHMRDSEEDDLATLIRTQYLWNERIEIRPGPAPKSSPQ